MLRHLHDTMQMMKPPALGLDEYMKALMGGGGGPATSPPAAPAAPQQPSQQHMQVMQQETMRLQQMMQKKQELATQMNIIDQQILKQQGALEMLKRFV